MVAQQAAGVRVAFDLSSGDKTKNGAGAKNRGNQTASGGHDVNWGEPHGVSPTFGAIGTFGATGLATPDVWAKEKLDSNCTTNPFIYPVFEHDEDNSKKLKWCPGFGDKWRWNINLGGAYVHGVWQNKGIY